MISMARPLLRRRAGEGKALAVTQGKGGQGPCCDAGQRGADLNAWADGLGGNVLRSGAQVLKYSENWKAKFMDCQKKVNQQDGSQGCNLTHILRHFSYAPQRFESFAEPRRKYACCLNAIAMTLAEVAGDDRLQTHIRDKAERCLAAMTAQDVMESGLAADFTEVCLRLGS